MYIGIGLVMNTLQSMRQAVYIGLQSTHFLTQTPSHLLTARTHAHVHVYTRTRTHTRVYTVRIHNQT